MISSNLKEKLEKIIYFFENDLKKIRTGRANPSLVEEIKVDYYKSPTPLNQLASINAADPKMIIIKPWDKNVIKEIENAINKSELGINPVNEGEIIRLIIPPMTEERRKEMVRIINQKAEENKIKIRNIREEKNKLLRAKHKSKDITEDDYYQDQDELQKMIDEYNEKIKTLSEEKEKEVMTI